MQRSPDQIHQRTLTFTSFKGVLVWPSSCNTAVFVGMRMQASVQYRSLWCEAQTRCTSSAMCIVLWKLKERRKKTLSHNVFVSGLQTAGGSLGLLIISGHGCFVSFPSSSSPFQKYMNPNQRQMLLHTVGSPNI